jgi:hypothetical protein
VPASLPEEAPADEHSYEDWANNWTPFEEDFYAEPEREKPIDIEP